MLEGFPCTGQPTAWPTTAPMPAVIAIATAPHATTRVVAGMRRAPPSRAPVSPEDGKRHEGCGDADGRPRRRGRDTDGDQRQDRAARERESRCPGGLQRTGAPPILETELVARMGFQRARTGQLDRDLVRQIGRQSTALVDRGELAQLAARIRTKLPLLEPEIRLLGVTLRTHRDVLAGGHRQRARCETGDARGHDRAARRAGGRDTEDQAGRRHDPVVGAEHRRPQPVGSVTEMRLCRNGVVLSALTGRRP